MKTTQPTVCEPRYATQPTPGRRTLGPQLAQMAKAGFGVDLQPWQRMVADVGLEFTDDGLPAYRQIIATLPRQQGKSLLVLAFEVHRALAWGRPQRIAYSAQDGRAARNKLLIDHAPLLTAKTSPIRAAVSRVLAGVGNEAIVFRNGSRISILNSSEASGQGLTLDMGVIDESWNDIDDRREAAMLPAMLTRADAQILIISTAGTERSPYLRRKVDAGRAAVANGETTGTCYFEYSADEDADPDDPATWRSCMPALAPGGTITEASTRHMKSTMTESSWRRHGLNLWTASDDRVLPTSLWNAACDEDVAPEGKFAVALDLNVDRSAASIAIADDSGRVELVDQAAGVGWVVARVVELAKTWDADVVLDSYGPAGSLAPEIEAEGVTVHAVTSREMTAACGRFYDAVADGKVRIRRHEALDLAAAAARKRQIGDSWLWGRKDSAEDVSPLVAVTLAYDAALSLDNGSDVWAFVGPGPGEW